MLWGLAFWGLRYKNKKSRQHTTRNPGHNTNILTTIKTNKRFGKCMVLHFRVAGAGPGAICMATMGLAPPPRHGQIQAPARPRGGPGGLQHDPNHAQINPRSPQDPPRRPKRPQENPITGQDGPKEGPETAQEELATIDPRSGNARGTLEDRLAQGSAAPGSPGAGVRRKLSTPLR